MASPSMQLSCELRGHTDDVRGVCACDAAGLATGSRDQTVCLWAPDGSPPHSYVLAKTMRGHSSFVGPVAWMPPNESFPRGAVVSGSMDTRVMVWDPETGAALQSLEGHELQVTDVAVTASGDIVSGSIDKTVRVWRGGRCLEVLTGHESSVLAVLALPTGEILSGSGDCTIKVWKGGSCIHTIKGHTDSVRGLATLPGLGIVSGSHDGTVRLWAQSGEQLLEMHGHTALVYSVATGPGGEVASGSEDNTAKIWEGGECRQSIEHPGCVWDVAFLPGGDLVTACSDGVARVWTADIARAAPPDVLEAYGAQLGANKRSKTVGGVKIYDLPDLEALQQPGKKDGQTKIVREGDAGVAYSWNAKDYNWDKIGEVVDGGGNNLEGKTVNGVTYDFVFDVDIGDGQPTRKLPYNRGDNPYAVADKWLLEQDLPQGYREQVVNFIIQNTGQGAPPPVPDSTFNPDPYTGSTSATAATTATAETPSFAHIPKKGMLLFDTAQFDGILKKVGEFSATLSGTEDTQQLALSEGDAERLQAVVATLRDTSRYGSTSLAAADVQLIARLALTWPPANLFPALDLLRMLVLHPHATGQLATDASAGNDVIWGALQRAVEGVPPLPPNLLTGARLAVNAFRHPALRDWAQRKRAQVLDLLSPCCRSANKNVRLAMATLILNYVVLTLEVSDEEGQMQALSAAFEMATPPDEDPEVQYRVLVAIGTLMVSRSNLKEVAQDLEVSSLIKSATASPDTRVAAVGKEIAKLL